MIECPTGTRFQRFGNPDGGREGRGISRAPSASRRPNSSRANARLAGHAVTARAWFHPFDSHPMGSSSCTFRPRCSRSSPQIASAPARGHRWSPTWPADSPTTSSSRGVGVPPRAAISDRGPAPAHPHPGSHVYGAPGVGAWPAARTSMTPRITRGVGPRPASTSGRVPAPSCDEAHRRVAAGPAQDRLVPLDQPALPALLHPRRANPHRRPTRTSGHATRFRRSRASPSASVDMSAHTEACWLGMAGGTCRPVRTCKQFVADLLAWDYCGARGWQ